MLNQYEYGYIFMCVMIFFCFLLYDVMFSEQVVVEN